MAADASAKAAKSPKKTATKKAAGAAKNKKPADHPKYNEMIRQALSTLKERGGSSRQAILKYVMKNFKVGNDEHVVNQHLKMALRAGVKNDSLKQSKGSGASGSFRLGAEAKKEKPAAKKVKKTTTTTKVAKKPKAASKPKSPKKAKKPAAAAKKPKADKPAKKAKADKPKKAKADKPKKAAAPKKAAKAASPKKAAAAKPKKAKPAAKPKKAAAAKKPAAAKKA